ncbi:MAG: DNA ligase D [Novosphingobium sp.]
MAAKPPAFRPPQLATLADHVPAGNGWFHEVKYDGYRCLIAAAGEDVRVYTRSGLDWTARFAGIARAFAALDLPGALIDGEVVAFDADGRPSFSRLQQAIDQSDGALAYFAFDMLECTGEDLTGLGNRARKDRLQALLAGAKPPIHLAEDIADGERLFETLCAGGYEGIVSKAADAPYRGRRSKSWLKVKCTRRQEFVVVGWSESERGRGFRSLLLATRIGGALHYAGKVGTGFSQRTIAELLAKLERRERKTPPLAVPREAARRAHWVRPELVAEIAFTETTAPLGEGGVLRHPSFLGLREDKPAAEIELEQAVQNATPAELGIAITNPSRVIYPEAKIAKGQLADYYAAMAEPILRCAADRPISLVRCPQGRAKKCFFQKHDSGSFGDAVKHVPVREKDGGVEDYLYVDSAAGLLACVQMGTIEFHGWGSRVAALERPDRIVFDLDPDEGLDFADVRRAAVVIRDELAALGLTSDPMLSGGKGIHVIALLDARRDWPEVADWCERFARALAAARPELFTANIRKVERKGRIFLDYLRNQRGATAVMPWTVRARAGAPVAAPLSWTELEATDRADRFAMTDLAALLRRARSKQLSAWGSKRQRLPRA